MIESSEGDVDRPVKVTVESAPSVVNAPVEAPDAPIVVASIAPLLISTAPVVDTVN